MAKTHEKERQLESEIAPRIEHDLPGVEVLAVELANPDRFVVYVDHPVHAMADHTLKLECLGAGSDRHRKNDRERGGPDHTVRYHDPRGRGRR